MITDRLKSLLNLAQSPVNGANNPILTVSCVAEAGEIFERSPKNMQEKNCDEECLK
jgi:hypothetical protein